MDHHLPVPLSRGVLVLYLICTGCMEPLEDAKTDLGIRNGCVIGEPLFLYPNDFDRWERAGVVSLFASGDFRLQELGGMQVPLPDQSDVAIEEIEISGGRAWRVIGAEWEVGVSSDVDNRIALSFIQHVRERVGSATVSPIVPQFLEYLSDASRACDLPVEMALALAQMNVVMVWGGAETLRLYTVQEMPAILLERVFERTGRVDLRLVLDDPRNPDALISVRIDGGRTSDLLNRLIAAS